MLLVFHRVMAYSMAKRFRQEPLKTLHFSQRAVVPITILPLQKTRTMYVVDRARFHDLLSTCEPSASNIETQHSDLVEALNAQPREGYEEMTSLMKVMKK